MTIPVHICVAACSSDSEVPMQRCFRIKIKRGATVDTAINYATFSLLIDNHNNTTDKVTFLETEPSTILKSLNNKPSQYLDHHSPACPNMSHCINKPRKDAYTLNNTRRKTPLSLTSTDIQTCKMGVCICNESSNAMTSSQCAQWKAKIRCQL